MSDEDREEALEQMRELFIQYPKEGRVIGQLVKQLENYSRWDTNTNNNARKEALEALEVHSEIVMEENVSSATLTTWASLLNAREIIGVAKIGRSVRDGPEEFTPRRTHGE